MKATELITAVQNAIDKYGDFDINVGLYDSETSPQYECRTVDGCRNWIRNWWKMDLC